MIKREDLVKVIKGKEVYYKLAEIVECEEIREDYSKRAIKEILSPYAVKLKGLGASKWIIEEDLYKVNFLSKTVHTNIDNFIIKNVENSMWGLNLALAFTGGDKVLGEGYREEKIEEIKVEAIEKAKNLKEQDIKQITETLEDIEEIKRVNKGLKQYNAEIVYEITDKFKLETILIAPNLVEWLYEFKELDKWVYIEDDEFTYIDTDGKEIKWKAEGDYLWDKSKSIIENKLILMDRDDIELDYSSSDFWGIYGDNINLDLNLDDLFKLYKKEPIVTFKEAELEGIKEQLAGINEEAREYVESNYSVE